MHPYLLDIPAAGALIRVSAVTTRRLALTGDIPATRIGAQWRIYTPSLLAAVLDPAAARQATPALPPDWQEPGIVTSEELADLLGLPTGTLKILLNQGRIPAGKGGGRWRAYWPAILAKIAAGQPLTDLPEDETTTAEQPGDTEGTEEHR